MNMEKMMSRRKFLVGTAAATVTATLGGCATGEVVTGGNASGASLRSVQFTNPVPTSTTPKGGFVNMIRKWVSGPELREPERKFGFVADKLGKRPSRELSVMWVGHSTMIIEIEGKRFLTDPIWSNRCSPVSFMGPERFFPAPLALSDIPRLDGVIISHDHYDHLDYESIVVLDKRGVDFYVPLGVKRRLVDWGVGADRVHELDWWQEIRLGRTHRLVATPARHFSGRSIMDRNSTLWASWVIEGQHHNVFFGGDSGYYQGIEAIGNSYGPFDYTMIEIGAYDASWADIHMGPDNALRAHADLKGKVLMPIHWGTFNLAFHEWTEPVTRILDQAGAGVNLALPRPGQFVHGRKSLNSQWWESPAG